MGEEDNAKKQEIKVGTDFLYLLHLKSVACKEPKAFPYKWLGVWQTAANCTGTRFAFMKVNSHLREQSQ